MNTTPTLAEFVASLPPEQQAAPDFLVIFNPMRYESGELAHTGELLAYGIGHLDILAERAKAAIDLAGEAANA